MAEKWQIYEQSVNKAEICMVFNVSLQVCKKHYDQLFVYNIIIIIYCMKVEMRMNNAAWHKEICEKVYRRYVTKNKDYGDSLGEDYEEYGHYSTNYLVYLIEIYTI